MAAFGNALSSPVPSISALGIAADWLQENGFPEMGEVLSSIFVYASGRKDSDPWDVDKGQEFVNRYNDVWIKINKKYNITLDRGTVVHNNKHYRLGPDGNILSLEKKGWTPNDEVDQNIIAALIYLVGARFVEKLTPTLSATSMIELSSVRLLNAIRGVVNIAIDMHNSDERTFSELRHNAQMAYYHLETLINLRNHVGKMPISASEFYDDVREVRRLMLSAEHRVDEEAVPWWWNFYTIVMRATSDFNNPNAKYVLPKFEID